MSTQPIKSVIFDMDGTIIDTELISKAGWGHALKQHGFTLTDDIYDKMIGRNLATARELLTTQYAGSDFDAILKIRSFHMEEHIAKHGLEMKKGLIFILDELDRLGIKKCIATSTEWASMEKKLNSLNLMGRFDGFVAGDQVQIGKPHPEIFLKAANIVETHPRNCMAIEDSPAGIASAHAAGIRVIMVPDIIAPTEETKSRTYATCNDLIEVAKLIEDLVLEYPPA